MAVRIRLIDARFIESPDSSPRPVAQSYGRHVQVINEIQNMACLCPAELRPAKPTSNHLLKQDVTHCGASDYDVGHLWRVETGREHLAVA